MTVSRPNTSGTRRVTPPDGPRLVRLTTGWRAWRAARRGRCRRSRPVHARLGLQSLEPRIALAADGITDPSSPPLVTLDNGRDRPVVGFFAVDLGAGGTPVQSAVTAVGRSGQTFIAQNLIFNYHIYVDVGTAGEALRLDQTTITMAPTIVAPGVVASTGQFPGDNGAVNWRVESSFDSGGDRFVNRVTLESANPLGALRVIAYLDEDVLDAGGDILSVVGAPGTSAFRAFTLDDTERLGFAQAGVVVPGAGLKNATYEGWAAHAFPTLMEQIQGPGTTYTVAGNIAADRLPAFTDPALGTVFGPADVTTAFAWTVNPAATSAEVTPFLMLAPTDPAAPFAMVSLDRSTLRVGETAAVTFTLTSEGTSFGREAVRAVNGTLSAFGGAGTVFTAVFTPTPGFTGTATIEVPAGSFVNEAGRGNAPTPPLPLRVDTLAPGASIVVDADNREPLTAGRTARLTFVLSEPATDFAATNVTIEGRGPDGAPVSIGTLAGFTGSGTTYTATFIPTPGVVGTATFLVAAGAFTDAAGNPNLASAPAPVAVDTRSPVVPSAAAVLAAGVDGNPKAWAREFAFTAVGPARVRITGLAAGPANYFGPRSSVTLAADGATEPLPARIVGRRYQTAARILTLELDTPLPVGVRGGVLTVGATARPAARLLDADTGTVLREVTGTDLVAAGYSPVFTTRYQGGMRVAAGDADGDGRVDLAVAPGVLPLVGRAALAATHGTDVHRIGLFDGTASGWRATSVDVRAIFGSRGDAGYAIALGDVVADADGGVELLVGAGNRIAVFDIERSATGPTIRTNPVLVSDLATSGSITSIATGAVFADPLADVVVAATTGTDRDAGTTTVTVLAGPTLAVRRAFAAVARVESGPGRRLVDVFAHGATVAVGDFDGDARVDLALGAGQRGLGSFRVLANAFLTAAGGGDSAAAIAEQLGPGGRFAQVRTPGEAWKPRQGPDYFTPGEVPQPLGLGFNAPVAVATATGGVPSTGGRVPLFVALGATNQTGNRIRRLAFAGPNAWTIEGEFAQRSAASAGPFASGLGLRLG